MIAVQGVAAAGKVEVAAAVAGIEQVVDAVVQPAVGEGGAARVALGGVVEHHVQDYLDPGRVQLPYHVLELGDLPAGFGCSAVAALRGEQANRVVGPVVDRGRGVRLRTGGVLVRLVHGQQFDRGDAERAQVGDPFAHAEEGARMRAASARVGGKAAHVHLVDHAAVQRVARVAVVRPVERRVHDDATRRGTRQLGSALPRGHGAGECPGIGVEEQPLRVEAVAVPWCERPVDPVQVAPAGAHALHHGVPDVSGTVVTAVQDNLRRRPNCFRVLVQQQRHRGGMAAEQRELRAAVEYGGAQRHRAAPGYGERGGVGGHDSIRTTSGASAQIPVSCSSGSEVQADVIRVG